MSKTKNETPAIEVGKPINLEDTSRKGLAKQISELVANALTQGLKAEGGFIEYDGGEKFSAVITFVKP
jgi:hypothetical protein